MCVFTYPSTSEVVDTAKSRRLGCRLVRVSMQQKIWISVGLMVGASVVLLASSVAASTVVGRLAVPRDLAPAPREDAHYWEEPNGLIGTRELSVDVKRALAVVLTGRLQSGERPDSRFAFRGGSLMPSTMVVQTGTELRLENTDACSHELYAEDIEGFGPLATASGNTRTLALPGSTGVHVVRDRLYSHVNGHIHVINDLVSRARLDPAGRFQFTDVPPGTYTLKVFYREKEIGSEQVEVPEGQLTIEDPVALNLTEGT